MRKCRILTPDMDVARFVTEKRCVLCSGEESDVLALEEKREAALIAGAKGKGKPCGGCGPMEYTAAELAAAKARREKGVQ